MLYNYKMYNANVLQNYSVTILLPILIYQVNGITKRTLFFFPLSSPLLVNWTNSTSIMYSGKMNKPLIHYCCFYVAYAFYLTTSCLGNSELPLLKCIYLSGRSLEEYGLAAACFWLRL